MGLAEHEGVVQRLFDVMWNGRRIDVIDDSHLRAAATGSGRGAVGPASR
jgi:hypothetical protein